ncbi:hypothetical protein Scep_003922 [Stephania cephalantha]|uniref:Uncharacterized protein n=1 Tax=Stephania cephalantha TaxID=152367 RepID=A0AAP0KRF6_9MAGN
MTRAARRQRRGSGGGAVNGVEQLRGDVSSDRSILGKRHDFDELDDVVDSNEVERPWQMVCSLLGDLGGAQLVTEEPSLSRRSLACRGGAQPYRVRWGYGLGRVWPWAGMALGRHNDGVDRRAWRMTATRRATSSSEGKSAWLAGDAVARAAGAAARDRRLWELADERSKMRAAGAVADQRQRDVARATQRGRAIPAGSSSGDGAAPVAALLRRR